MILHTLWQTISCAVPRKIQLVCLVRQTILSTLHQIISRQLLKYINDNTSAINLSPLGFFGDSHHDVTIFVLGDTTMQRATVPNPTIVIECAQYLVTRQTVPPSRSDLNAEQHARWPRYYDTHIVLTLCIAVEK